MRVLPLSKNYVAIISAKHFRRVNKYKWHVHFSKGTKKKVGQPYARATIAGKKVYLHRFITGAYLPMHVDHENHQNLDCRDSNLIVCTYAENMKNRRKKKKVIDIVVCELQSESLRENSNQNQEGNLKNGTG
jgi:hypothetical protein